MNFLDIDRQNLASRALLDLLPQAINLRAFAPYDDAGPSGVNGDSQLVARTLDFDGRHTRSLQLALETLLELQVLVKKISVILLREPTRLPGLVVTQAEPIGMNLLTHLYPPANSLCRFGVTSFHQQSIVPCFQLPTLPAIRPRP